MGHHSTVALIAAVGVSSAASAVIAAFITRKWTRNLTVELTEVQRLWAELQRNIALLPEDNSGMTVSPGDYVAVREFGEVSNSSLWDNSHTQYCRQTGTVVAVDEDGDATVRLDSGQEIVCDVKFLLPSVANELKRSVDEMKVAMRALAVAVRPGVAPVSFE